MQNIRRLARVIALSADTGALIGLHLDDWQTAPESVPVLIGLLIANTIALALPLPTTTKEN